MSNVAATVLIHSIITPLCKKLPPESDWPKQALLGVAFSCNVGGMVTPIASPQASLYIASDIYLASMAWSHRSHPRRPHLTLA